MGQLLRWRAVLALAGALSLITGRPLAAQSNPDQRESPEVVDLSFTGVHHVSTSELARSIATQATQCKSILLAPFCLFSKSPAFVQRHYLDRLELKRDVLRIRVFYWRRGYREAKVDTSVVRTGDGVKVAFTIAEGAPTLVQSVDVVQGEPVLSEREIQRSLLLQRGRPLDLILLDSSHARLRERLWDKGYSDAELRDRTSVAPGARAGSVRITIDPRWRAVVDTITVEGNAQIGRKTIHNMITLREQGVFRRSDLVESQRNLYESNLFRRATISLVGPVDSAKHVDIRLEEAPFRMANVSAGFNTVDFVQVQGRFTHYDWLGGARRLDLNAVLSNLLAPTLNGSGIFQNVTGRLSDAQAAPYLRPTYEASANVTQPWFKDPRNTIGAGVFAHRRSAPGIYIDRGYGANASFTRELAPRSPLSVVYQYELTEVDASDVYFCVNYGVCEAATVGALRGRHAMSPLSASLFTDRTDNLLSPTTGYRARLDVEHASALTLSKFRYNRISGDATRYFSIGNAVLAGHVRFGWVKPLGSTANALGQLGDSGGGILHPRKRFYAGGAQSVRGYDENQLGPRVLTVDPAALEAHGCTAATIADGTCNPSLTPSRDFQPRPTGGTSLIEGSVEYRFPIWRQLGGAVFVDGAFVGQGSLSEVTKGAGAVTPGFGVRYQSPVGPIRVDLGIRPTLKERLRVLTQAIGSQQIVELQTPKLYDPLEGSGSGIRKILSRLTLHLSIGQAY